MQIPINDQEYLQANTNANDYLLQNTTENSRVKIIVSDTKPADNASADFVLKYTDGISDKDIAAILWAKSISRVGSLGLIEGA